MYQWVRELWRTKWGKVGVPALILGVIDWCARFEFVEGILLWLFGKKVWAVVSSPWTSPLLLLAGFTLIFINYKRVAKMPPESEPSNVRRVNWRAAFFAVVATTLVVLIIWNVHLQKDISSAQKDVSHLKVEMARYVLPRELTKEQIATFGKYLSSHSEPHEVTIKYILDDVESEKYANDLSLAFSAGNWLPSMKIVNPSAITCRPSPPAPVLPFVCSNEEMQKVINGLEGISILSSGPRPPEPSTLPEKVHPPTPVQAILSDAFKVANIQIGSTSGPSDDPSDKITVFVGMRPRSKFGVRPPNFYERVRRGEDPNDMSDDDF